MKITGTKKITVLILKATITIFLLLLIKQAYAQELSSEVVTTTVPKVSPNILDQIERFYEISEKSLKIGYNVTLNTDSAFQTTIGQKNRYIIANNFSQDKINLVFISKGDILFNRQLEAGNYVIFKIEDIDLKFMLHSSNSGLAQVELKTFEEEIPEDVDYFELFDIQVRLADYTIYSSTDLSAITEFTNFGEGPSHVRLVYSITDNTGKEYYTGIYQQIVETNEVLIKNFNTLKIPHGQYTLKTTIYYGKDQEATSEETFILTSVPKFQILKQPVIFIAIILTSFTLIIFLRKRKESPLDQ